MKSSFKRFTLLALIFVLAVIALASCDALGNVLPGPVGSTTAAATTTAPQKDWALVLTADKTELSRGDTVTLSAVLKAAGEEDLPSEGTVFHVVSGSDYITRSGNKSATFTVLDTAPHGAEIKLMAQEGATLSEVITLTVNVPATSVTLTAGGAVYLPAGEERVLTATVLPVGAADQVTFTATEGASAVEIVGNVLKVKPGTPSGTRIKVKATVGTVSSEELSFTVGYPLSGISISAPGSLEILPGATSTVTVLKKPEDAVDSEYRLEFMNDCSRYASISGNVITVSDEAIPGTEISVRAVSGTKTSNTLTFTVGYPLEDLTISADVQNILAGKTATVTVTLAPVNATNGAYHLEFVNDCAAYATINGNVITVSAEAATGSLIKVKAVAGDVDSNVLTFTVGYPLEDLTASADKENILAGETATVTVTLDPANATNGTYHLEFVNDCAAYATINGNVITVSSEATTGSLIKVKAVSATKESNVLTFTVGYPLEDLTASADKENILAGETATVTVTLDPANATNGTYHLEFVNDCAAYATINGNVITVSSEATTGSLIKVKAVSATKESNVLTFTVGYPLESITAKLGSSGNIDPGSSAALFATIFPLNATNGSYEWKITEGSEYAEIVGDDTVKIKSDATLGATVKVKAVAGAISSNEITIIVGTPINTLTISSQAPAILDRGGNYPLTLTATPEEATLTAVEWKVTEGAAYASVVNRVLLIAHNTPAGTKVTLHAASGSITSNTLSYTVGVKLEDITVSLGGVTNVEPGASAAVSTVLTPDNATDRDVTWVFDEGGTYATITSGALTVNADAPVGAKITFHAVIGEVESDSLTVTVGIPPEKITISLGGVTNVDPGASATASATLEPGNASEIPLTWVIDAGADYATLTDGTLTVKSAAPVGAKITFHAEYGAVESAPLTVTVGIPPEKITISLDGVTSVEPGASAEVSATLEPGNASAVSLTWKIDEGGLYATLTGGVITVKSTAPIGATVTFHAEYGEVKSAPLTVTVGVPVTGVTISAPSTDIVKGTTAELDVSFTPGNASQVPVLWQVTVNNEATEYASVSKNNVLSVSASAPTGTVIKVVAVAGGVTSNELSFTVGATQEEINASRYFLSLSHSTLKVDTKGLTAPVLSGYVYNANFDTVTDKAIVYSITEGAQYLQLVQSGNTCTFVAKGHGRATVTATIPGTAETATVAIDVVVPPDAIDLPAVFLERTNINYAFSMVDPDTGAAESLPFVPVVRGESQLAYCTDYTVNFLDANGKMGDEVAVYENGAITFKTTGKVTVIVTSRSGSHVEATTAYTFDINTGYNVYNFVELQQRISSKDYDGQIVNMVVLEKPVPQYETSYPYGYDMVPPSALYDLDAKYAHLAEGAESEEEGKKLVAAAIVREILRGSKEEYGTTSNRIQAINKSVWINGNGHKIDASQLRVYTRAEQAAYEAVYNPESPVPYIGEMFSAIPWGDPEESTEPCAAHTVRFYNIEVVGNCPIDFTGDKEDADVFGCFTTGISVGALIDSTTDYYVTCDNIKASGYRIGIYISKAVGDSKISNLSAYNCYASGLQIDSSHLIIENMTFGKSGACAVEISPGRCHKAGILENETTRVTFAGSINASENLSDGNTEYFKYYMMLGTPIPNVIAYNLSDAMMNETQRSHILNEKGEYNFISLLVNDISTFASNDSEVKYPAYQAGGIIDVSQLTDTVNTTHQYITMDIKAEIPGMGIQTVGRAIFYNMNYGK